jgi:hypothetical protein
VNPHSNDNAVSLAEVVRAFASGDEARGSYLLGTLFAVTAQALASDLRRELRETAGWLEQRADVLAAAARGVKGLAFGTPAGDLGRVLGEEAGSLRGRAGVLRRVAEKGGAR